MEHNNTQTNGPETFCPEPMAAADLFSAAGLPLPQGLPPDTRMEALEDDSRQIRPGALFVASRGATVDGHDYIPQALDAGASLVLAERIPSGLQSDRLILLPDTRHALGRLAHAFYGNPSRTMRVAAVTGTNGKTTTAYLVEALLRGQGFRPLLFSTVEYRYGEHRFPAPTTTPGALFLARAMAWAKARGADAVAMEASSHALMQGRLEGIQFDVAAMTNLTQDHLDYHLSMEAYSEAKRLLFTRYRPRVAVFNLDDVTSREFARTHEGDKITFSLDPASGAGIFADCLQVDDSGVRMAVRFPGGENISLHSPLRGRFNAANLLTAISVGIAMGLAPEKAVASLETMHGAPGRFERIEAGQPFAIYVDYAHTPDSVERVLENVRAITTGRVIALLGCGGDRDKSKRAPMGAAMGRLADFSIITNDNPRTEDPIEIARGVEAGISAVAPPDAYAICLDRREAIEQAIAMARPGDSVVIAGKGHEDYVIIGTEKMHFDDREVAREICRRRFGNEA